MLAVRLTDIKEAGIRIDQDKTGKKLLIRWNPYLRRVFRKARPLIPERKIACLDQPQYPLGQRNGQIRSYTGVCDLWSRACKRAGIEDAHILDLRAKSLTDADSQRLDAPRSR